jgi:protein TonB
VNLRQFSTLQIALGISVAVHAVLLAFRFVDPAGFNRVFADTPLEVILVNASTNEKVTKPQALAQASLAGGGDADKGRATTPLPPSALTRIGDAAEDKDRVEELELFDQQRILLAQRRAEWVAARPPDSATANKSDVAAFEQQRKHQLQLIGEIERRINEQNARPRKRYITVSTKEDVTAIYFDGQKRKTEDKGTRNFPRGPGGVRLYGELVIQTAVAFDGHITEAILEQSSGNPMLDRQALAIAKGAGPFGPIPAKVQAKLSHGGYNRLAFIQHFTFHRDGSFETRLLNR